MIIDWREWIERYVHEVVRRIPRDRRVEAADELRSRLTAEVESRLEASDREPERVALERLAEMGDPADLAYQLAPEQTVLVGPRVLPFFWKCVAGVLIVHLAFTALWVTGFRTDIFLLPFRFVFLGTTSWVDVLYQAIAHVGVVALVFAAVQRWFMGPSGPFPQRWDPRELQPVPARRAESRPRLALRIAIVVYVLFGLHFAPGLFPYLALEDGTLWRYSLLHPVYHVYLPWIDLWLIPTAVLLLWEMERGETGLAERWTMAGLDALGAIVLFGIALGGPFTVVDKVFDPLFTVLGIWFAIAAVRLFLKSSDEKEVSE